MPQLQLQMLFSTTDEKQQNVRLLKASIKEALEHSPAYQQAKEAVDKAKESLKQVEISIKQDFVSDLDQIDAIKADLEMDKENLTAIALEKFRKGEELIVEKNGVQYVPTFSVKFKKAEKSFAIND